MLTLLKKDLLIELRRREVLPAMLVFAVLVAMVFSFAFELDPVMVKSAAGGVVWGALVFSAMLGFQRSFSSEQDRHTLDGLLLAPVNRFSIFISKMLVVWIYVLITALVVLPVYSILSNINLINLKILLTVSLGSLGFCTAGTLIAALSSYSRAREVLLPVLLLPVALPLLMAAVRVTNSILQGAAFSALQQGLAIMIGFDIILLVAAWLMSDILIGE